MQIMYVFFRGSELKWWLQVAKIYKKNQDTE